MNHEAHEAHEDFVIFVCFVVSIVFVCLTGEARAQGRLEVGAQVVSIRSSEFEHGDIGVGGRVSWHPLDLIGADAELTVYPRGFPDGSPFSRSRVEGLFGVTVGPRVGRARPFVKMRPGFLTFRGQPVACILIFPPPLSCVLAEGRTVFALDLGGGVQLYAGPRAVIRIDAGDRALKYPGPSFRNGRATPQSFFSHDLRLSTGVGFRL